MRRLCTLLAALVTTTSILTGPASGAAGPHPSWVGTWSTGVTAAALPPQPVTVFENQTLRQIAHISVGGGHVRVRLSNEFGTQPLTVGEARIARRPAGATGSETVPGTDRLLTFGGRGSIAVPPGAPALSDPVPLAVPAGSDLVISIYLPARTPAATVHNSAYQTNYVADGNVTRAPVLTGAREVTSWHFLSGISVSAGERAGAVVAFGDSITDGAITTVGADHRWPDFLARRFQDDRSLRRLGVLNEGIGGNRLLHAGNTLPDSPYAGLGPLLGDSALTRFDRDVAAQPGARYVVVLLGINDISQPGSLAPASEEVGVGELVFAYRQLIARAHERGLRVFGATLTPFEGTTIPGYYSPAKEAKRQAVNEWIRAAGEWDGVVDFDRAVRDPARPLRMLPAYDSGDHLHPNDAGMQAMAQAVPLRLFHR